MVKRRAACSGPATLGANNSCGEPASSKYTPAEIFVFDLTDNDMTVEPGAGDGLASDTFDFALAQQQSLDIFNISDTQVANVDGVRFATIYLEAIGIPERTSLVLLCLGDLGLLSFGRRRKR